MKYIKKELRRHLWRTIASISGYGIAALFIILFLSVNGTNESDSFGILKGTGTHFIVYFPSKAPCCISGSATGSIFADGVYTQMLNNNILDSVKRIEGIRDAAPYLLYQQYNESFRAEISIGGVDTTSIATKNNVCAITNLIAGKYISDKPDEIVAEESFAIGHKLSLGDTLKIFGGTMKLAGIINSGIKPGKADFYTSIDNLRNILKDKLQCQGTVFDMNIILVEVADSRIQERVMKQLKQDMSYLTVSTYNCYQPASQVMSIIGRSSTLLSMLIFIFLIVFSVKTQLTSLVERYREIGILKSLGWTNSRLSWQILIGSVIQSVIGASVGALLGAMVILLINKLDIRLFDGVEFHFHFSSILILIALSLIGGIIAGIFPILKLHRTKAGDMINNYL